MKNKTLGIAFGIGLAVIVLAGCIAVGINGNRAPGDYGFILWPAKGDHPILEQHWSKIETALANSKPDLYYIQEFKCGEPVGKAKGSYTDIWLQRHSSKLLLMARGNKFTGHAIQVGVGFDVTDDKGCYSNAACGDPSGTPMPDMPQAHFKPLVQESANLISAINAVLQGPTEPTPAPCDGAQ